MTFAGGATTATLLCAYRSAAELSAPSAIQELSNFILIRTPANQTDVDRGNAAIPIDQECRRKRIDPAVQIANRVISEQNAIIDFLFCDVRLHGLPAFLVHGDAEDSKPPVLILSFKLQKPGDLQLAGSAPRSPEIEQHHLAPVVGQMNGGPVFVFE